LCNPMMKMMMMIIIFCPFRSSGAPVEWNWQGKTGVLGEKPVPMTLCPQIPHGLTRDRTRASEVGGRRLTAWAMARPITSLTHFPVFVTQFDKGRQIACTRTYEIRRHAEVYMVVRCIGLLRMSRLTAVGIRLFGAT
jgi:hypothetical protein